MPRPDDDFAKKGIRNGQQRYQSWCRPRNREYQRDHYAANIEEYKAKAVVWRRGRRTELFNGIIAYLREHPCVDCGETDPVVLQFDHVRGIKRAHVARLVRDQRPWAEIAEEIKKCDVRCANCHFRKTATQLGWWRHLTEKQGAVGELEEPPVFQTGHIAGSNPACAT